MNQPITVKLLFFGAAREVAGAGELEFVLPARSTAQTALQMVLAEFPLLETKFGKSLLFAVNQTYADKTRIIKSGDELAIFPPVSGG